MDERDQQDMNEPPVRLSMPPEIAAGIVQVQGAVKSLHYDSENKYQSYSYASIDAFLLAIGPIEAASGIFTLCDEVEEGVIEMAKRDRESGSSWLKIKWAFTIGHKSGALYGPIYRTVLVPAVGAQAYGSAQSYALKQFLRGLYKIATGDNDDPDAGAKDKLPDARPKEKAPPREKPPMKPVPNKTPAPTRTPDPASAVAKPVTLFQDMTTDQKTEHISSRIVAATTPDDKPDGAQWTAREKIKLAHEGLAKLADIAGRKGIKELDEKGKARIMQELQDGENFLNEIIAQEAQ